MDIYSFAIQNKEFLKIIYGLIIWLICVIIVFKTDKLFEISLHQGIKYLRNAFFFYGFAFFLRYIVGSYYFVDSIPGIYYSLINIIFAFFLAMAGFFLVYSLIWKKIEPYDDRALSSFLNARIMIFYFLSLIIAIMDYLWKAHNFLFISQIVIFFIATIISFSNFSHKARKQKFPKFYFIAMLVSLVIWIVNALASIYFNWDPGFVMNVYFLNVIVFLIFLYGVKSVTKKLNAFKN